MMRAGSCPGVRAGAVLVVGGGPAGLMAATVLAAAGTTVELFDVMPRIGRKFLLAGQGGLNLTRQEALADFAGRYGAQADFFRALLDRFSPEDLRDFLAGLGVETFVGTSGRVFPRDLTAAGIIERWRVHLAGRGVRFHVACRLVGIDGAGVFRFERGGQRFPVQARVAVLAFGGASWPQTGSDGRWAEFFRQRGIGCAPFAPANCGVEVDWSEHFRQQFAGTPLKNLLVTAPDGRTVSGDAVVTGTGLEGGAIYPLAGSVREAIARQGEVVLHLDLKRDLAEEEIKARLARPRGRDSLSEYLRKTLRLGGPVYSLLRECCVADVLADTAGLAKAIKRLPVRVSGLRPLAEAISTAGGVLFSEVDEWLMLRRLPGVFVAGEMLDWEAPTGGYLLQGAFSTGWLAGQGAQRWLASSSGP